ncbi:PEP-CTERM sorting domain-containing protein [Pseudoduganella lutea]|nr:PEP-CTERM sorting domain-containing protein [Pseudoduganella lutea]
MNKTTHIAALALMAAAIAPAAHAAPPSAVWIDIQSPATSGFTVGSSQVTYGPVAADQVWVYDGANITPQNAANIENIIETQFNLPGTGVGSLVLVGQNDSQSSNSFTLTKATSYLAIHYGRGELLFHWDTPLAANTVFQINNLPRGISNFRAFDTIAAPVPEPSTYAMMVGGLALLGFVARRRKQA